MKKVLLTLVTLYILMMSMTFISFFSVIAEDEYVFGTNLKLNDDSGSKPQRTPEIVVAKNGNVFVTWADERNGNTDIFLAKSTDSGKVFGDQTPDTDIRVDDDLGSSSQRDPAMATYNNGIYLVWMDDRPGFYHIYFTKSTDNGETFSSSVEVDDLLNDVVCEYPDIAVGSSDGKISVVWQAKGRIYYSESSDGGSTFSSGVIVDNSGSSGKVQKYPSIAIGSNGDKYVAWQDNRSGGINYDIYFATAGPSSTSFQNVARIDEGTGSTEQTRPAIAASGTSKVYLTWRDERAGASGDIYFDKSTNKGSSWGTDIKVDDKTPGSVYQDKPKIAIDDSENIHMIWEDRRGSNKQIYYSNSTDGGTTFSSNLRVDDATSNIECYEPSIAALGTNKIFIAWKDKRNSNYDIYFSRWGIKGQMGYLPTLSELSVTPKIAGADTQFKWEVVYTDLDDEPPDEAAGYPKLYIYTDHSKSNQLSGSPYKMIEKLFQDGKYTNGEIFSFSKTLKEAHNYAYMIEVKAVSGDTNLVPSDLKFGPKIDVTPPVFSKPSPDPEIWINSQSVNCEITITDPGGSGVDKNLIKYQYLKHGDSEYSRYFSITNENKVQVPDGYRCTAKITFNDGAENYIIWNATDEAKSDIGYAISELYQIKVDTTGPTFTNPEPRAENWQNDESVTCSITVQDIDGSGVNGSSIIYYYKPAGTAYFIGPFSPTIETNGDSIVATTSTPVEFYNGKGNQIKWEATDLAGNKELSTEFDVNIDTNRPDNNIPEAPKDIGPADTSTRTPHITWEKAYDADPEDELEYFIQIGTFSKGNDILNWTSTGTNNYYFVETDLNLIVGSTYYVQVRVFDGLDYSITTEQTMNITATGTNTPPTKVKSIEPKISTSSRPMISWSGATDADNDTLIYYIRIGTQPGLQDIHNQTRVDKDYYVIPMEAEELKDGIYYINIRVSDGEAISKPYTQKIKIATFQPELELDKNKFNAKQGDKSVSVKFTLLNNGTMSDNITINYTGNLAEKSSVVFKFFPLIPIMLNPGESKKVTLTIELPSQISPDTYRLVLQPISENEDTGFQYDVTIEIKRKEPDKPSNGDDGGDDTGFSLGSLLPLILILIIVIVIIGVIAGVVSYSKKKKMKGKEEKDFFRKKDDYEKLYGPKKEY